MSGGDLFDYLERRDHFVPENRDLKIENIMMSSNSETAVPKLVDFGLSIVLSPNETICESIGTL
jgi:serine/threonine protein kinase